MFFMAVFDTLMNSLNLLNVVMRVVALITYSGDFMIEWVMSSCTGTWNY